MLRQGQRAGWLLFPTNPLWSYYRSTDGASQIKHTSVKTLELTSEGWKKKGLRTSLCSAVRSRTQISADNLVCVRVYLDVTFPLTSTFAPHQQLVFVCSPHRCPVWTQADAAGRHASMRWAGFTIAVARRSATGSPRGRGRAKTTFAGCLEVHFHQVVASQNNKLSTNSSHHLLERFVFSWSVSPH